MRYIAFFCLVAASGGFVLFNVPQDAGMGILLDKSVPYVGADIPRTDGIDGSGIRIAVIDTGVDFDHPDLQGWGPDGKVVGGYNFVREGELPLDANGHGTQVAGVIAADGEIKGVAPKAEILAYKVSEDGEGVSSDLIIRAIEMAVSDGADIINISLGVNKTNPKIERAVDYATRNEILVVTAAGNDGPGPGTIGSPGRNMGSLTVGASYNNLTSSLVATLQVDGEQYTVIPMVGSDRLDEPISAKIAFGGYGKDLDEGSVRGSILLVERGSDTEGELLYFSVKERNAADAGAVAMIVYNDEPGIFLGELIHEFTEDGYEPRIPVVSVNREEGLKIRELVGEEAALHLFYNPDFVAHFSSRGPVSPFYIKPEIVAPGAYINTTQSDSRYNFTSGTSYAVPHVSGAAALLMQKNPDLDHGQIKSLLLTTAKPVSDAYGAEFSVLDAGAGRVDIKNAYGADLVITPPSFVSSVSMGDHVARQELNLTRIWGDSGGIAVSLEGPESVIFGHVLEGDVLRLEMDFEEEAFGDHEGRIVITHGGTRYVVPFLIHYTQGSVGITQRDDMLLFDISHPQEWSFAKIEVTNSRDGTRDVVTTTPGREASVQIYENAEYWIDARIRMGGDSADAFGRIEASGLPDGAARPAWIDIPGRQVALIAGIIAATGVLGAALKRNPRQA